MAKIFFLDNVEWNSKKLWEMISADTKANKNKKVSIRVSIHIDIVCYEHAWWWERGVFLTDKIC